MKERIVEIIVYLISELKNNIPLHEIDLTVLTTNGYTPSEISTAFTWLYEKIDSDENVTQQVSESSPHSHRVLHDAERSAFSPEAFGYLVQLRELGLLKDTDLEAVIDRIMLAGYISVNIPEVKSIVAGLLLELDDSGNTGSRIMLNSKDTIN
jgi:uncharacterized protein Smg (DUF494 family)